MSWWRFIRSSSSAASAQKVYILHKKPSLSGTLCAKPCEQVGRCKCLALSLALLPNAADHTQAREADCEPTNLECVSTTRRYCRACPRSWLQCLLLTMRVERRSSG